MIEQSWRIELFGGLRARQGNRVIGRFRTQKTGALLAYLAYFRGRTHGRETLIELLWPDVPPDAGRHSLSQALSSLRSQLEPPGVPAGSVIIADKLSVELNPDAFTTDVAEFEQALRQAALARNSPDHPDRETLLTVAVDKYGGALLDGYYEDWITAEQERIASRFRHAAVDLLGLLEKKGDSSRAVEVALRAVDLEPLNEDFRQALMRSLASAGQPAEAVRQYREFERLLETELGQAPQSGTRELLTRIEEDIARAAGPSPSPRSASSQRAPISTRTSATGFPTGTVTFLFTDIEGSTALWERTGSAFRSALSLHHALLRSEFRRNGGVEVKEAGDSFLVAFGSALDAVSCAVACQRGLAAQDWPTNPDDGTPAEPRVRMAIHTGEVELDEVESSGVSDQPGQDYHGLVLHRASRMLSAAHGGQILCSEASAALTRRDLDPSVRLRDLGMYHLRDVEGAERLFQVEYADSAVPSFPPLRATPARAARLPVLFTRFFGRENELHEIGRLMSDASVRLVTLTGTGGTGKTRLAIEVARQMLEGGQAGDSATGAQVSIWFVPLADVQEPGQVTRTIADAMSLPPLPHVDPRLQITEALREGPSILILDNFEQLVDGGAEVLQVLLLEAPELKALVTSRVLLGLDGEREFAVAPLPTPHSSRRTGSAGTEGSPERVSAFESVRLFVDRAQAVKPDFQVTNSNAPAVAELCDRLEGIPLAIELAAARAQMMTPATMLEQLANRFDFLVSRKRGTVERQRTLRSAVDWSYRLLAPDLQQFFLLLSVFRGGWTVEAAESVCEEPLALDFLAQLRDGSLVLPEEDEDLDRMRFRMLESLREYADEKLRASGAELDAARERHAGWILRYATERLSRVRTPDEVQALGELSREIDNLRAAFAWAREAGQADLCAQLALALASTLHRQGYIAEACAPLDSAFSTCSAVAEAQPWIYAAMLRERAGLHFDLQEWEPARSKAGAAREAGNGSVSPLERARAENLLGMIIRQKGDAESLESARDHFRRALSFFEQTGEKRDLAIAYNNLGWVDCREGGDAEGEAHLLEALRLRREVGDRRGMAETLTNLGVLAYHREDWGTAWDYYREALEHEVALRHTLGVGRALFNLGEVALERGEASSAARMLAGAERLLREVRSPYAEPTAELLGRAAEQAGMGKAEQAQLRATASDLSVPRLVLWALAPANTRTAETAQEQAL